MSAKFCMRKRYDKNCNFLKSKMADGRHFENRHISVKNRPILVKFGTLHQILNPVTVTWPKQKLQFLKFKMAAAAIWKFAFLAITHRPIVRFRPNVVCGSRTACRQGHMIKTASFQNPRWRTAAILKIVNLPYPSENIVGFWQNLVYYSMYWTWWGFQKRYRRILDVMR